eukprot:5422665-Pyramimonas_sp.AAC.1
MTWAAIARQPFFNNSPITAAHAGRASGRRGCPGARRPQPWRARLARGSFAGPQRPRSGNSPSMVASRR